jgi:hypothetical protein
MILKTNQGQQLGTRFSREAVAASLATFLGGLVGLLATLGVGDPELAAKSAEGLMLGFNRLWLAVEQIWPLLTYLGGTFWRKRAKEG